MSKIKALYLLLSSEKVKSQFHALVTSALALYTALHAAGLL